MTIFGTQKETEKNEDFRLITRLVVITVGGMGDLFSNWVTHSISKFDGGMKTFLVVKMLLFS